MANFASIKTFFVKTYFNNKKVISRDRSSDAEEETELLHGGRTQLAVMVHNIKAHARL